MFWGKLEHKELAYGSPFDWKNAFSLQPPFFFPFKLRWGPSSDDVVIVLDDNDQVLRVTIPKEN